MGKKKELDGKRKGNFPGRPYSAPFVKTVVALAKRLGSCRSAAIQMGVHVNTVRAWMRKASKK